MNFNDVVGWANQRNGVAGNTLAHGTCGEGGMERMLHNTPSPPPPLCLSPPTSSAERKACHS